jgi:hypothetical protein
MVNSLTQTVDKPPLIIIMVVISLFYNKYMIISEGLLHLTKK